MVNYTPPDLTDEEVKYSPHVVSERFTEDLEDFINIWIARYPRWFRRYDVIIIMEGLKQKLEGEENLDRRRQVVKEPREPEHGQYIWIDHRQQWVLINGAEAERLNLLQEDDDRST